MNVDNCSKQDLIAAIRQLKEAKHAVILAHYYTTGDIQDIADFVGDSLALAQKAASSDADIIVMCGVHFMGETCKILCPQKKVLVPDVKAGCSLADSCPTEAFAEFVNSHPDHTVLSYVNTTAATKYYTDIVVTSGNALKIVNSLPVDEKIIFGPDRNLGTYINKVTGRNMLLWDGACHVHEKFTSSAIMKLKIQYPEAKVLVHPECTSDVAALADEVGSTAALLSYVIKSEAEEFIVVTESGILHEMQKQAPDKKLIPLPVSDTASCACNECEYMRMNTLEKLYQCLLTETPEITVDEKIIDRARLPITRMLELSK